MTHQLFATNLMLQTYSTFSQKELVSSLLINQKHLVVQELGVKVDFDYLWLWLPAAAAARLPQ